MCASPAAAECLEPGPCMSACARPSSASRWEPKFVPSSLTSKAPPVGFGWRRGYCSVGSTGPTQHSPAALRPTRGDKLLPPSWQSLACGQPGGLGDSGSCSLLVVMVWCWQARRPAGSFREAPAPGTGPKTLQPAAALLGSVNTGTPAKPKAHPWRYILPFRTSGARTKETSVCHCQHRLQSPRTTSGKPKPSDFPRRGGGTCLGSHSSQWAQNSLVVL